MMSNSIGSREAGSSNAIAVACSGIGGVREADGYPVFQLSQGGGDADVRAGKAPPAWPGAGRRRWR